MSELAIVAALDALEAGDPRLAEEILLATREDGDTERRFWCLACGTAFRWPGLRDAHLLNRHGLEEAA
jgi:hypothetical protein